MMSGVNKCRAGDTLTVVIVRSCNNNDGDNKHTLLPGFEVRTSKGQRHKWPTTPPPTTPPATATPPTTSRPTNHVHDVYYVHYVHYEYYMCIICSQSSGVGAIVVHCASSREKDPIINQLARQRSADDWTTIGRQQPQVCVLFQEKKKVISR